MEPDRVRSWERMTVYRATGAAGTLGSASLLVAAYLEYTGVSTERLHLEHAGATAEAACRLAEAAHPTGWSAIAVEDAVDAIGTLVEALSSLDAHSARLLAPIRVTRAVERPASAALEHLVARLSAGPGHPRAASGTASPGSRGRRCPQPRRRWARPRPALVRLGPPPGGGTRAALAGRAWRGCAALAAQ
ncbi:hypothetical protein CD790_33255 [Streptomyces sp. SAJ15]|nr:hypothetical protein CD790_33255 [Streptomyces sp. SAJ15]